ncbi:MAG: UDP-glucose/GDP-mannose dehydrogenase family protein [Candidatus Marinimicrobia bacterium]|nr:UDP-glucose/GDP-mannose dehydrogenase family protein [Candidatus Neomarinimicrobiota bacterium]
MGTGYVGLVTGACLADLGNKVRCVDVDVEKIKILNDAKLPIYEPGLQELIDNNVSRERLSFSEDISGSIRNSEVVFIAVGTPSDGDGNVDLRYVEGAAEMIAQSLADFKIIVNKSTVSIGTGKKVAEIIENNSSSESEFEVVSNPEFLREGSAVNDFMHPDRIVIGTNSEKAYDIMTEIYGPLYLMDTPFIKTNVVTAELIKYASNAFLSVKISFINEIANVCDKTGADVHVIAKAMGLDGRISPKFLHAGPGFGGSCFPKDTLGLVQLAKERGITSELVEAAIKVNKTQRTVMVEKLKKLVPNLKGKTIAVLGLAFKPNTDDVRESPALDIIKILLEEECIVHAYDPVALDNAKKSIPELDCYDNMMDACEGADSVMIMTEWNELRQIDLNMLKEKLGTPNMVDCRNIYDPKKMKKEGFNYLSVGRPLLENELN